MIVKLARSLLERARGGHRMVSERAIAACAISICLAREALESAGTTCGANKISGGSGNRRARMVGSLVCEQRVRYCLGTHARRTGSMRVY